MAPQSWLAAVLAVRTSRGEFTGIRLINGNDMYSGTVQVEEGLNARWGGICESGTRTGIWSFGTTEANVVCRQIFGTRAKFGSTTFGWRCCEDDSRYYTLDKVDCSGSDSAIWDCDYEKYPRCFDGGVSVNCEPSNKVPRLRLVNGDNKFSGRVEVFYGGEWGRVCQSVSTFSEDEANVVCRHLFGTRSANETYYSDHDPDFGVGTRPVWISRVRCRGYESKLWDCSLNDWGDDRDCDYDLAVRCRGSEKKKTSPSTTLIIAYVFTAVGCLAFLALVRNIIISRRHYQHDDEEENKLKPPKHEDKNLAPMTADDGQLAEGKEGGSKEHDGRIAE